MVAVWLARVDDAPGAAAACDAAERARAARHRDEQAGRRWLTARGVVRRVVGAATGVDGASITFTEGAHGKPAVAGVELSISHAGPIVAVAVADHPVGIDIEVQRPLLRPERLAARLGGDASWWYAIDEDRRTAALLRAWTRAEAVLKATGTGASGGLTGAVDRLGAQGWLVRDLAIEPDAYGALAARGTGWQLDGPHWYSERGGHGPT